MSPMNPDEIRDQQKATWNKFSAGWKKWDELSMRMLAPAGEAVLSAVNLKETDQVLDVASGTGEPGLSAAARVKKGKVIAFDLAEGMIATANETAKARGLKNFESKVGSAEATGLPDASVDAVLCRFGFMFFPDIPAAVKEFKRVLKPGGRFALSVWSAPERNPWATTVMSVISRYIELPQPPPEAPGLFRCAKPGFISDQFRQQGFKDVSEKEISWEMSYGPAETYWNLMTEMAAPVVAGLAKADAAMREKIHQEVLSTVAKNVKNDSLHLGLACWIVQGVK